MFFVMFVLKLLLPMILGVIVGVTLVGMGLSGFWKSRQTQQWQTTTGKTITTWVEQRRARTRTVYQPKVSYEYIVNYKRYQSERIRIGDRWGAAERSTAEQQIKHYPPGSEMQVYYNPHHPEEAVLKLQPQPALYWLLAIGGFFLCINLFMGSVILPSAMKICGVIPTSTHAQPNSPSWCKRSSFF